MNASSPAQRIAFAIGAISLIALASATAAKAAPCAPEAPCGAVVANPENDGPSWIFNQSTYTHDPHTGARVAQYMRTPPVEPLPDERLVTSRYRRSRTNLRGTNGSVDTYYEVQAWGNGRGGIDAEWERFHDAWKESFLQGGYYNQAPDWGGPWNNGGPWNSGHGYGYGYPGYGFPGHGYGGWGSGGYFPPHGNGGHGNHHDGEWRGGHGGYGHDDDHD
ncbi:MAG: hypothetical protein L0228_14860 [Planctomycetes bacterium]|nr:hypothetical protein [Planctomycetota bacterium]